MSDGDPSIVSAGSAPPSQFVPHKMSTPPLCFTPVLANALVDPIGARRPPCMSAGDPSIVSSGSAPPSHSVPRKIPLCFMPVLTNALVDPIARRPRCMSAGDPSTIHL